MVLLKKNFRATLERGRHDRYLLSTPCLGATSVLKVRKDAHFMTQIFFMISFFII